MEDPRPQLNAALKEAMKNKDSERRNVIRLIQSAIKQVEIDSQKELDAAGVVDILQKEAKKRRETIDEAAKTGRGELAENEKKELAILEEFLPQQMDADEIGAIVDQVIEQVGAESAKDMGKVMGPVMAQVKGRADGKLVNQIVREKLNA